MAKYIKSIGLVMAGSVMALCMSGCREASFTLTKTVSPVTQNPSPEATTTATTVKELEVPSNVKNVVLFQPEFADYNYDITKADTPEKLKNVAASLKNLGYTAVAAPIFYGVHPEFKIVNGKLQGELTGDSVTNNTSFKRVCDNDGCGIAKILEDAGVGVIPEVVPFFGANAYNKAPAVQNLADPMCLVMKPKPSLILGTPCVKENPDGFTMWNDTYWLGIEATFRAAAKFACTGPLPQRIIAVEGEDYMQYRGLAAGQGVVSEDGKMILNYWIYPYEYKSTGAKLKHSDDELYAKIFERGQQIARAISNECGADISIYYYTDMSPAKATFLYGLTSPEVKDKNNISYKIKRAAFLQSPYYRSSGHPFIYDMYYGISAWLDDTIPTVVKSLQKMGYSSNDISQLNQLFTQRGGASLWATVYYDRFYGMCTYPGYEKFDLPNDHNPGYDFFRDKRIERFKEKTTPWFDIPPEYADEEMRILKQIPGNDTVFLYQGSNHYLCGVNSPFCSNGDYHDVWADKIKENVYPDADKLNSGKPNACRNILNYFSEDTINQHAQGVSAAIAGLTDPVKYVQQNNDEVLLAAPSLAADKINPKKQWTMDELEVLKLDSPWKRASGSAEGDPSYVLEVEGTGASSSAVAEVAVYGWLPHAVIYIPEDQDVFIWAYLDFGDGTSTAKIVYEGADINFDKIDNDADFVATRKYTGWHWVKVARRYLQGYRNLLTFTAPPSGSFTRIGGIKFVPSKSILTDVNNIVSWNGIELQEWIHSRGWSRDASTGGLRFDPAGLNKEFSYTTEWIAIPGRKLGIYVSACMLIDSDDSKTSFTYSVPLLDAALNNNDPLPKGKKWIPAFAPFSISGNYRPFTVIILPNPGTSAFTVEAFQLIDAVPSSDPKKSGNYDIDKTNAKCGLLPIPQ